MFPGATIHFAEYLMPARLPLSFLDLTPIESGSDAKHALATSVELAKLAE